MWSSFFLENLHFALNLGAFLVFFAVFWLYFDAWTGRKTFKEFIRFSGFLVLAVSFLVGSLQVESIIADVSIIPRDLILVILFSTRLAGYLLLIIALQLDPLMAKPSRIEPVHGLIAVGSLQTLLPYGHIILPVFASLVAILYLRRATIGLENHLKPVSLAFFVLALSEFLSFRYLLQNTHNTSLYNIVAPLGPVWIIELVVMTVSFIILGRWVIGYLLKRIQSQLFMIFTTAVLVIFLITTVVFSFLLLRSLEKDALNHLKTDVNVLQYSIDSKKAEMQSDAEVIAQNPEIIKGILDNDKKILRDLVTNIMLTKKQTTLTIISKEGIVMARGEDPERVGDSLSSDPLVREGLDGGLISTIISTDGVASPVVSIKSAAPIKSEEVIGIVIVGTDIDNTFVDGMKAATGLEASIYADNIRSATTFVAPDGKSRWIGIKEENENVKKLVLKNGEPYVGAHNILGSPFLAAYLPLKDIDNAVVGMLFVGRPQVELLQAAGKSIEITFLVSAVLLILSIVPAFVISRYITRQIR